MKSIRRKNCMATMISFVTSFAVLVLLVGMTGVVSAVVYHQNEVISTDTTWSVDVHVINASSYVQVSDNVELTIPAGAVVKFNSSAYMEVRGTLNATGTASEKIVFTSLKDDSFGGDTNGDGGASSPAPGDWGYINIYGLVSDYDGVGIFEHSIIRYGGSHTTYPANVYSDRSQSFTFNNSVCEYSERNGILSFLSSPVITNSTLRHNGAHGLHSTSGTLSVTNNTFMNNSDHGFYSSGSTLSVTNNTFTNNTNYATYLSGVTITSLRDNTGSGNGKNGLGISGTVSTNQTWDMFFPYIILGAGVIVSDNKILTLEPGVVMKFNPSAYMEVRGTLNATGTASEKIVFTSLKDDSFGGDTNGDGGASSPAPGDWGYINIYGLVSDYDGVGIFEHSIIRYGGSHTTYPANVYSDRSQSFTFNNSVCEYSERNGILSFLSSPVITNSTLRHNGAHGLHSTSGTLSVTNNTFMNNSDHGFYSSGSTLSVTNNTFTNNTNYATYLSGVTITSLRDNTGSGNGKNGLGISGTVSTNQTWDMFFPYIILGAGVIVSDNKILTLEPGVVMKFNPSAYMEVRGTLNATGTASEKIVFTSLKDDSFGGDTNGDGGASSPAPGDWGYINIYGLVSDYDGVGIFEHSIIRYGGSHTTYPANVYSDRSQSFTFNNSVCEYSERNGILSFLSSPVITNSTLRHNGAHGLHSTSGTLSVTNNTFMNNSDHGFYSSGSTLSVTNNTFTNNTNYATYLSGVTITSLRDNTGSGNGKNGLGISGTVSTNQTWDMFFPYIILGAGVIVSDNKILTLESGVVMKFNPSAYMEVRGTLNATGTASEKIVFTSLKDDSFGGDTNGDGGASSPAPGDWGYINIYGLVSDYDGVGIFEHSIIRYGGSHTTYPANVYSDRSQSFTFNNSVCEYSERNGILSFLSSPVITNSTLRHNGAHGLHSTSGTLSVTNNTFMNNSDHGFYSSGSTLSVTNNTFTNNTNYATYLSGVTITSLRDNTGSGNGKNGLGISGTVSTNQTWDTFFPYIILGAGVIVSDNKILTLESGVVMKFNPSAYMEVRGTLNATGTASEKIVFTSLKDDSFGGDTNGDGGASSPAPGDWGYIRLYGLVSDYDGVGIFEHSIIRYGGSNPYYTANVYSDRSHSFTFNNSVCEYSERNGIYLHSSNGGNIIGNTITNNNQSGIYLSGSNSNLIYNNYFNNTNNAYDNGNNRWNTTKTAGTNIIGGPYLGGNYWSNYTGKDQDGDGLGDTLTPHNSSGGIQTGGDYLPLTLVGPDTTPPASITNLQNVTGQTWINWSWTNPPDADFNYTMVYLDGAFVTNTSNPCYNATGLAPDTYYEIGTHTVDTVGNMNTTWVNQTTKTLVGSDTTPPASITNLQNVTGQTWINWSWTNPPDADFNYTMVYLDGVLVTNTSNPCYNATGLALDTYYEIGTHTVDTVGNMNTTWVNQTTKTLVGSDTTPPVITNVTATNITMNSATISWDTDEPSDSLVKYGTESGNYVSTYDAAGVTTHRIALTGLSANTTYYYVVNSTDASGNSNESLEHNFSTLTPPTVIPANVVIKPETLNLNSTGVFTAFITLLEGYNISDIDISTVICEGALAVKGMVADDKKYIAKFDREDLIDVEPGDSVTIAVTGTLYDKTPFAGNDTITVIAEGKSD